LLEVLDAAGGKAADVYHHFNAVALKQPGKFRLRPGAGA